MSSTYFLWPLVIGHILWFAFPYRVEAACGAPYLVMAFHLTLSPFGLCKVTVRLFGVRMGLGAQLMAFVLEHRSLSLT